MRNLVVYDNLHQQPMNINNTTQVNPVPCDPGYPDSVKIGKGPYAGCVDFVFKSTPEEGGALFSPKSDAPLPTTFQARYFGFNRRVMFLMPDQLGRDEFDLKVTFAGGLQSNWSNEINWSEGGMWQADPNDPPKWVDSGFNVANLIKWEGWNDFMFRGSTDGKVWNIDSLYCNGTTFTSLPASYKGIPLKQTNWSAGGHMQLQAEVMNTPAFTVVRYQNAQIVMSDNPIPTGWF